MVCMDKVVTARTVRLHFGTDSGIGHVDVIEHSDQGVMTVSCTPAGEFIDRERHEDPFLIVLVDQVADAARDGLFTFATEM